MKTLFQNLLPGAKFFTPSMGAHLLEKLSATEACTRDGKRVVVSNPALRVECITPLLVKEPA